jgi:hypothetical protein
MTIRRNPLDDVWFAIIKLSNSSVRINRGAVFRFTGAATPLYDPDNTSNQLSWAAEDIVDLNRDLGTTYYVDSEELDVSDGDKIYLRYESIAVESETNLVVIGDDGNIRLDYAAAYATAGVRTYILDTESFEYVVQNSVAANARDAVSSISYLLIAEISITDGILSINQKHKGLYMIGRESVFFDTV